MKALKCIGAVEGFTVGKDYGVCAVEQGVVVVCNDSGRIVAFGSVEGDNDFKNWFVGVTA